MLTIAGIFFGIELQQGIRLHQGYLLPGKVKTSETNICMVTKWDKYLYGHMLPGKGNWKLGKQVVIDTFATNCF